VFIKNLILRIKSINGIAHCLHRLGEQSFDEINEKVKKLGLQGW